jgi:hypothetical protein
LCGEFGVHEVNPAFRLCDRVWIGTPASLAVRASAFSRSKFGRQAKGNIALAPSVLPTLINSISGSHAALVRLVGPCDDLERVVAGQITLAPFEGVAHS